jgi:plasmid stabilization system protein ParE
VIRRKVRFTATAQSHVRLLRRWWLENSAYPEILQHDLDKAITTLSVVPGIGSHYPSAPIPGVRRLYLERLMSHLYYTYDEREVVIRALWHARRGSGPEFGPR